MNREELEQMSDELELLLEMAPKTKTMKQLVKQKNQGDVDTHLEEFDDEYGDDYEEEGEEYNGELPEEFMETPEGGDPSEGTHVRDYGPNFLEEFDEEFDEELDQLPSSEQIAALAGRRKNQYSMWIRPSDGLVAAFFVPVLIMVIIFAQRGIFPFGEESFLRTDMYHQYAPFFSEFREKIAGGGSLLYSWNIGMGVNFAALYAYYLASPLNWLMILCPKNLILEFMTYMIVIKIGLSGLSFAYYLKKHCRTNEFGVAFFGIFYALSGYMAAYSWNIMWLDCIWLLPLIVLGLERLVKEKKCFLYCITLGLSITSNYYISIMICMFMVLYFISLLILEGRRSIRDYLLNVWHFSFYSLIAGGLAAAVLIPEIYALQMTASGDINFPKDYSSYFSIFDMIARHIGNVEIEIGLDHWPNIYCGVAVFIFFLLYLVCKKISIREKVVYCSLLLIFFASFSINVLNFIWHGFHYPNSLPCRQSFIYIFLILLMCYQAYINLKDTPWKHVVLAFLGSVAFVLMAQKLVTQDHFNFIVYYIALIFLALYAGLIYLFKQKNINPNRLIILTLCLVSVEAAINTTVTSVTTTSRTSYLKDNASVERLTDSLVPNTSFYRVEKVTRKTKNDGAWMNFPTVSLFSSTANAGLSKFFKQIGCESSTNAYSITGATPLIDTLFAVKYGLYNSQQQDTPLRSFKAQDGDTFLYENLYPLSVAFMLPPEIEESWQLDLSNPADVQNNLAMVAGTQPVLEEVEGTTDNGTFRFTPETRGEYYVYITNKKVEKVTATVAEKPSTFDNVNRGFLVELGLCEVGDEVVLNSETKDQKLEAKVYRFSEEGLMALYDKLNQKPMKLKNWTDTYLAGSVNTDTAGLLFTSIPYDEGWSVTVDGEPWKGRKVFDTFLAVDLPEGQHTVEFTYMPQGLQLGLKISGGCIAFLVIYGGYVMIKQRHEKKENSKRRRVRRESL